VPPLRERPEDIPLLAARFLGDLGVDPARLVTRESLDALVRHAWPGNVRELRNTLERAVALSEPLAVTAPAGSATPAASTAPSLTVDLTQPLRVGRQRVVDAWERAYITRLLDECGGNVSEASRRAGLERMSMYRLLHRLGLR
jgi:DNA-binding NtrC family response regulator